MASDSALVQLRYALQHFNLEENLTMEVAPVGDSFMVRVPERDAMVFLGILESAARERWNHVPWLTGSAKPAPVRAFPVRLPRT